MSPSFELQQLVYNTLLTDAGLLAEIAGRVYDRVPRATPLGAVTAEFPFVSFGPHSYIPDDYDCVVAGEHTLQIDVWSRKPGFPECKRIADLVKKALHDVDLMMAENALASILVESVGFVRDADGLTSHGVVLVRASVEEC